MMKSFFILMVKGYQLFISPFLGQNCRFYPSCSQYMIQAIEQRGVIKGMYLGIKRLSKCHPFNEGGLDPVPPCDCTNHKEKTTESHKEKYEKEN